MINIEVARKVLETIDAGLVKGVGEPVPGQMCVEAAVCYALDLPHGDDPGCVSQALRLLNIRLNDSNWSSDQARTNGLRRLGLAQLGSAGVIDDKELARRVAELAIRTQVPAALRAAASRHKDPKRQAALNAAARRCESEASRASAIEARDAAYAAYAAAANAANAANAAAANAAAAAANAAAYAAYAAYAAAAYAAYAAANAANAAAYAANAAAADAANAANAAANAADARETARDASLAEFAEGVVQILTELKAPGVEWLVLTA